MQATTLRAGCPAFTGAQLRPSRRVRTAAAQASSDPLLQKPVARPAQEAEPAAAAPSPPAAATITPAATTNTSGVSIEFQRQQAKAMRTYFQNLKMAETIDKSKVFGWTYKNELLNGRWVMMGFFIGLMTEYATGVSFIDQLKLMASYMGLVDMD